MVKILFVCHGNICRSPMAELVFKKCIQLLGIEKDFHVESKGTSNEEEGNPVYNQMIPNIGILKGEKKVSMVQLSELVNLARKKGVLDKDFDKIYYECDRDYDKIKDRLENIEVKENGR